MRRLALLFLFAGTGAFPARAGNEKRTDFTAGLNFPSNNDAILSNPGVLGAYAAPILDVTALWNGSGSNIDGLGSFVGGKGSFGYGFGFMYSGGSNAATFQAGLGYDFGAFELGVGDSFTLSPFDHTFNLGMRLRAGSVTHIGLVIYDFTNSIRDFGFALGFLFNPVFHLDLNLYCRLASDAFAFQDMDGRIGLGIKPHDRFSLILAYTIPLMPNLRWAIDNLEAGLAIWITKGFGIYGLYNGPNALYQAGIKGAF